MQGANGTAWVLGDALTSGLGNRAFPDTNRFFGAPYSQYLVNQTPSNGLLLANGLVSSTNAKFFPPYEIGSNNLGQSDALGAQLASGQVNNAVNFGNQHSVWTVARSTPYTNFIMVANGSPTTADDNLWQFVDVISSSQVAQCCANSGVTQGPNGSMNCGQFTGGGSTSACGMYLNNLTSLAGGTTSAVSTLADANWQAYVHTNPGQFDQLMASVCANPSVASTNVCSCISPPTLDPTLPATVQQFILSNPACYNPQCPLAGYKNANQLGQACNLTFQQCLQNQGVTNLGTLAGTPNLTSVINCTLAQTGMTTTSSPSSTTNPSTATPSVATSTPTVTTSPAAATTSTSTATTSSSTLVIFLIIIGVLVLAGVITVIVSKKRAAQRAAAAAAYYGTNGVGLGQTITKS